jgi:ATP-dependent DNA helicase Rep
MYVGITRAQRGLTITWCGRRKRGGETVACEPSRFLTEIDPDAVKKPALPSDPESAKAEGKRRLAGLKAMLGDKG